MYEITDLFDKRSVVGTKIEQLLIEKKCTKAELCIGTGVSRPTIDKLLAGTLTSKINYEKHISKILNYLETTPDMLLGKSIKRYSRIRELRNVMRLSMEELSNATGITLARLMEIEAGEEASVAELRDIAMCLSISVKVLQGENYFEPQIAELGYFVEYNKDKTTEELSGFWGHVGILLKNTHKYLWFPVTGNVRNMIYQMIDNERLVIPCMNNKVLYLNMPNVKEIVLRDEACDQPPFANWDSEVNCGEIPLVVYEALEDYVMKDEEMIGEEILSSKFLEFLDAISEKRNWSEEDIINILDCTTIYYEDGKTRFAEIDFADDSENISGEIANIYDFGDSEFSENILFFTDLNGIENFVNVKNISMIELPFLKVEDAIIKAYEQ